MVEELLKSGKLPCLVATSSLELGIDMGARRPGDPGRVAEVGARGACSGSAAPGHQLGEVSKGRIFPKFRADLLECAVVAKRMRDGEIEETVIPRNPLDVLAQHLVSMVADDEWEVDEVERVVTASRAVLRALARAARERARHARRPLPVRALRRAAAADRLGPHRGHGPRPQGRAPARGHQRRHDPRPRPLRRPPARRPPGRRARRGDGLRGAPGPDLPARRDHLADRGDHPRPGDRHPGARGARARCRSGAATGSAARRSSAGRSAPSPARRSARSPSRSRPSTTSTGAPPRTWSPTCASSRPRPGSCPPTRRSWSSASATRSATGGSACSRPSAAASTPPGGWRCRRGSATSSTSRRTRSGPTTGSSSTSPTPTSRRAPTWSCSSPTRSRTWSCASSAARRCSAPASARTPPAALLIPRAYPGKRTPLWQQRLKSQSLLEVAKDFPRFPVILETYRECLRDVLDLPALVELLRDLHSRKITLVEVETQTASPFASSLLFDYVATYMYEGDTPNAERRAAALALDRDLLSELLGAGGAARADRPRGARGGRGSLQLPHPDALAKDRDALQQVLRRLGDLTVDGVRGARRRGLLGRLDAGEARGRAPRGRGADRRRGALDRRRGRGPLPRRARRAAAGRPARRLPRAGRRRDGGAGAPLRAHPRPVPDRAARPPLRRRPRPRRCSSSSAAGELVRGELLPGGTEREWCDADVLRRVRRASLARAAPGGRGGRPRRAGPLPARVAERRRPPARPAPAPTACARRWSRCRAWR